MTRLWLSGRFRRRFTEKGLRYLQMKQQGFFAWQEDLDRLLQIQNRISEGCAFRKAKYSRSRTHAFQTRRDLDKKANPDLAGIPCNHNCDDMLMFSEQEDHDVSLDDLLMTSTSHTSREKNETKLNAISFEFDAIPEDDPKDNATDWEVR